MIDPNTRISDYMTKSPHTIGAEQTIDKAHELMRDFGIRHLPVLHGGRLAGIVTVRDLHLLETLPDVDPAVATVEEAMSSELYVVEPKTPLGEAARHMARRKIGSAIVASDKNEVVGVFTTTDALRALADALS